MNILWPLLLTSFLSLSSCGGGGGGANTNSATPASTESGGNSTPSFDTFGGTISALSNFLMAEAHADESLCSSTCTLDSCVILYLVNDSGEEKELCRTNLTQNSDGTYAYLFNLNKSQLDKEILKVVTILPDGQSRSAVTVYTPEISKEKVVNANSTLSSELIKSSLIEKKQAKGGFKNLPIREIENVVTQTEKENSADAITEALEYAGLKNQSEKLEDLLKDLAKEILSILASKQAQIKQLINERQEKGNFVSNPSDLELSLNHYPQLKQKKEAEEDKEKDQSPQENKPIPNPEQPYLRFNQEGPLKLSRYGDIHSISSLLTLRRNHSLVTMENGRILIVGGERRSALWGNSTYKMAEIYDPQTNQTIRVADTKKERQFPKLISLKDGRVLVYDGDRDDTVEIYNPVTDEFSMIEGDCMLPEIRSGTEIIRLPDGRVLLIGGRLGNNFKTNIISLFDYQTGCFTTEYLTMHEARYNPLVKVLANGKVFIAGGGSKKVELFDPQTNQFELMDSEMAAIFSHGKVFETSTGKIVMINMIAEAINFQIYNPETNSFYLTAQKFDMTGVFPHMIKAGPHKDLLYLFGGSNERPGYPDYRGRDDVWIFDPASEQFKLTHAKIGRGFIGGASLLMKDGKNVLLNGGYETGLSSGIIFNTDSTPKFYAPLTSNRPIDKLETYTEGTVIQENHVILSDFEDKEVTIKAYSGELSVERTFQLIFD